MENAPTPANILAIGFSFWQSKVLLSAVELGVFNELAKGPADLATLSQKPGLHARSARDFLDALVALKLIDRQDGRYSATAIHPRPISISTGTSQATLVEFSRWQMPGFIPAGAY